jgi:hypothetical protein
VITIISLTFKNLGIFNWWSSNRFDIGFKEFNLISPQDREDHLDEAVQRFEDAYESTTVKGMVELATASEVDAGTDTERAVTAASLNNHVSERLVTNQKQARARHFFMGQI